MTNPFCNFLPLPTRLMAMGGVMLGLSACASSPAPLASSRWLVPSEGQKDVSSGTPLERLFPLVDGMVYTYATLNETGDGGLLIARVHRTDARRGELRFASGAKMFEFAADGIRIPDRAGEGTYILKMPLSVGTVWRGEHGGESRVLNVSASADTPAGHFDDCVQTLEERKGDRPVRYATTFCPGVGVVLLEAAAGASFERASLKTYAPPLRMKDDGSERMPVIP